MNLLKKQYQNIKQCFSVLATQWQNSRHRYVTTKWHHFHSMYVKCQQDANEMSQTAINAGLSQKNNFNYTW